MKYLHKQLILKLRNCCSSPANSVSSLQYAGTEDGDTLGSRDSTSSGQQSGTSEQPSSHSYLSGHSTSPTGHTHAQQHLQVETDPHLYQRQKLNPSPHSIQHSPKPGFLSSYAEDGVLSNSNGGRGSTAGSRSLLVTSSPEKRPLLQTFHPKKHTSASHERFHANTLDGVGYRGERDGRKGVALPQRRAVSRDAVAITEGVGNDVESVVEEKGFRPRTHSDSCDKRVGGFNQYYPVSLDSEHPQALCRDCGHRVRGLRNGEFRGNNSGGPIPHEIQEGEGCINYSHSSSCSKYICKGECNGHTNIEGRAIPSAPVLSSPQSSTPALSRQHHRVPAHHNGRSQQGKGCVHNKTNNNKHRRKPPTVGGPDLACSCERDCCSMSNERLVGPPCCCEVMRDSKYCTNSSPSSDQWRGEEDHPWCHHDQNVCSNQQYQHSSKFLHKMHHQHSGKRGGTGPQPQACHGRSSSSSNIEQDPGYSGIVPLRIFWM